MVRHTKAEPGTGTQAVGVATPPNIDDGLPCVKRINGRMWKVGHDYLDTEMDDVCELVEIVRTSSWCDTRDADDCPPKLVFEYERWDARGDGRVTVDPLNPDRTGDFIERYTPPTRLGEPDPPW